MARYTTPECPKHPFAKTTLLSQFYVCDECDPPKIRDGQVNLPTVWHRDIWPTYAGEPLVMYLAHPVRMADVQEADVVVATLVGAPGYFTYYKSLFARVDRDLHEVSTLVWSQIHNRGQVPSKDFPKHCFHGYKFTLLKLPR